MPTAASIQPSPGRVVESLEHAVDHILQTLQGDIVLAIPLGIGKPNPLVNALYRRMQADPSRRLKIFTALSLEKPRGASELEAHFLAPLLERVFEDYPDLDYVKASRSGQLPAHIEVHEFFMKTGDYLGHAAAQQGFVCTNYSFAVRDMLARGVNLLMQAVAAKTDAQQGWQLSLSCNPDLSFDLWERARAQGRALMTVAMVNPQLPFMGGHAQLSPEVFDLIVDGPACSHALFAPPNASISWADYAIGLHAASLVKDGGTLQIGIGSLGDAIAQSLLLRDRSQQQFQAILRSLCHQEPRGRELKPFEQGLYGCSEMFVNGFMRLIQAGVIRREVHADLALQTLANAGRLGPAPDAQALQALLEIGAIASPLRPQDLHYLIEHGVFKAGVCLDEAGGLRADAQADTALRNDLRDPDALAPIAQRLLGPRWRNTCVMHGGFFLGPRDFYQALRDLPPEQAERIDMTRIGFINELYGDALASEALKRAQRGKASFINTTMKVSLLGAAASDALESGQVVSGVGGQYNFVAMAHALPDARSILMLRACHDNKDGLRSNIVWSYANCTIPRHLRDVVITEYGVADLRGCTDAECIQRLLHIADSRFQAGLMAEAKAHGKLAADYQLPDWARHNTPEALRETLRPWRNEGVLPDLPFGTDLNDDELVIVRALKKLKHASRHPVELVGMILRSLGPEKPVPAAYLERLGLHEAKSFKDLFIKRLFASNL